MTNARLVILFLGTLVLLAAGGCIYLAAQQLSIPDVLVALATGGLGALSSLLVRTSDSSPVTIQAPSTVKVDPS